MLPLARDEHGNFTPPRRYLAHMLRLAIFAGGSLLALGTYSVLGSALSLLGGLCSITCSLVLPTAFYSLLAWPRLGRAAAGGLAAMLALGLSLVALVTAQNVCELLPSCRQRYLHAGLAAGSGGHGDGWDTLAALAAH